MASGCYEPQKKEDFCSKKVGLPFRLRRCITVEVNTQTLAACLGISQRMVRQLAEDDVVVRTRRGVYDLEHSVQGYINFKITQAKPKKREMTLEQVKTEHEFIKMRKTELTVRTLESKLHKAEDVERFWTTMASAVKTRLLAIAVKVSPEIAGIEDKAQIQKVISREVADALNEISEYNPADFVESLSLEDEIGEENETEE